MVSRNALCSCGSSRRMKHCCGAFKGPSGDHLEISDAMLLAALKHADDEHRAEGLGPGARDLMNIGKALQSFGIHAVLMGRGAPPIARRAQELNSQLFLPKERQSGGLHLGAFLFRDMFCRLYAPIAFGTCAIDFWQMLELSDLQKAWLAESPEQLATFTDQAADILDFGYGWQEFGNGRSIGDRARDLIWRAHVQLEAAAATATGAYDYRGTVQSALLGTELALKAGLAAHGMTDRELAGRGLGHNLTALTAKLATFVPDIDANRIGRVVATFPDFVSSRYDTPPPDRVPTGHIIMGAQYVASEVTRRFSDRDCRSDNPGSPPRAYPA